MNTPKFTKGPWTNHSIPGDGHIMAGPGRNVAIATGWAGILDDEYAANKALIASAPELFAALEAMVEASVVPNLSNLPKAREQARLALAKAQGKGAV